jgi:hypothetical protein
MHFPHDNQGQTQPTRPDAHSFCLGAKIESLKNWQILEGFRKFNSKRSEGPAPGYEVPTLPGLTEKEGKRSIHVVDFSGT